MKKLLTLSAFIVCGMYGVLPQVVRAQHQGHQMPSAKTPSAAPSPTPTPTPSPTQKPPAPPETTDPHMNMPGMQHPVPASGTTDNQMHRTDGISESDMNMGPLLVMTGDDMSIRVGSSATNLISMGAMGSGTSWQPSSTPLYMHHKQS